MQRFIARQRQRNDGLAIFDAVGNGLCLARFCAPDFGCFAGDAETRFDIFGAVFLVDEEEAFSITQLALNERDRGVFACARITELRAYAFARKCCFNILARNHAALADLCFGATGPKLCHQCGIFGSIMGKARAAFGLGSDHRRPAFGKCRNALQSRQRHFVRRSAQIQRLIPRAALGHQLIAVIRQCFEQRIIVHKVIGIFRRRILQLLGIFQRGERCFLAVIIGNIGGIAALLQHVAIARQIIDPRLCHFRPSIVPIEILAKDKQRQPGNLSSRGWCTEVWITGRLMPFTNSRSMIRFRYFGVCAQGAIAEVIDSAAARFCP